MNSSERFHAALGLETPDHVPVMYQHLGGAKHVLQAAGLTMREGFSDPEVFAKICLKTRDLFGYDNLMMGWGDLLTEARAHGSTWKFPERDFYPRIDRYAVQSLDDVDKLHPVDPLDDEFWSVPIKAGRLMIETAGKDVPVVGSTISPMFVTSELRGYENLMMDTMNCPDAVHKMVQVALESAKMYGERVASMGVDTVFLDDSSATGSLVSPEMCESYDTAYVRPLIARYRELGIRTIVHNDAQMPYLDLQAAAGPAALHFNNDYVNLSETFEKLRGKLCVISGINHQDLIFRKSAQEVEDAVKGAMALYGKAPGLIIAPGCEMPFKSPVENIVRLREACEKYGRY
jgi:uroporphyrinogen decarboxylase